MNSLLTPPRFRGIEILDDPQVEPALIRRSMRDVARANVLFGGRHAALSELRGALEIASDKCDMLDIGTGLGDIPRAATKLARRMGVRLRTVGIDMSLSLALMNRSTAGESVCGDGLALPFRDNSFDITMASQVLHHFPTEVAVAFVKEMNRVARKRVVISDLRRNRIAAAGLWIGSFPLLFHPVSRHDGVVSVMRGFLPDELADIVQTATGKRPVVRKRIGFRLTTSWDPQ